EFLITAGKSTTGGAQEIGWDALSGHIKSWSFFEDGSYGTGLWSLEGHVWMVLSTRVYPDGKVANSTQVYKFPEHDVMIWKSINGTIDGQPTDDFEVTFKKTTTTK